MSSEKAAAILRIVSFIALPRVWDEQRSSSTLACLHANVPRGESIEKTKIYLVVRFHAGSRLNLPSEIGTTEAFLLQFLKVRALIVESASFAPSRIFRSTCVSACCTRAARRRRSAARAGTAGSTTRRSSPRIFFEAANSARRGREISHTK